MYFIDLEKLRIKKESHYETQHFYIKDDIIANDKYSFCRMKDIIDATITNTQLLESKYPCVYEIEIAKQGGEKIDDEEQKFLSAVNICLSTFFRHFITSEVRDRERRLDVPDKLKSLKCPMGIVKRMTNNQTIRDHFNFIIKYDDLIYILADEKEDKSLAASNFVHEAAEAPEVKDSCDR